MSSPTGRQPSRPNIQQLPGPGHEVGKAFCEALRKLTHQEQKWVVKQLVQGVKRELATDE